MGIKTNESYRYSKLRICLGGTVALAIFFFFRSFILLEYHENFLFSLPINIRLMWNTIPKTEIDAVKRVTHDSIRLLIKWEELQKFRKLMIAIRCRGSRGAAGPNLDEKANIKMNLDHLTVDDIHKVLYCYIPKVACTQWKRIMMVMTGKSNATDPETINRNAVHYASGLKPLSHPTFKEIDVKVRLETYQKFLFVRHPIERLLSAYLDKFTRNNTDSKLFQKYYAYNMMSFARHGTQSVPEDGSGMTFQEFLHFLIFHDPSHFQEHWKSFYNLCHPCEIEYDFIGKFDTIEEDSNNILKAIGASNITFPLFKPSKTKSVLKEMMKKIPDFTLSKLYLIYENDFRLFGYS